MIYLISMKNAAALSRALGPIKKDAWVELLPQIAAGHKLKAGDQVYLDIAGLSQAEMKKAIGQIKKSGCFWGIIDPKGAAEDPASIFFIGASDYIGPVLVKKGLNKKRFAAALSWALDGKGKDLRGPEAVPAKTAGTAHEPDSGAPGKKKIQKLPAGKFEGWKSIRVGATGHFFFLFVSLSGKSNLVSMMGEASFNAVKHRLRDVLQQGLGEADALLWMDTESYSLFLVPPRAANARLVIEAALKMILNGRLIGIEKLDLSIPVEFTFAFHYGQSIFQAPGKTGGVISESVNYIFHLGLKKAEAGRLTVSGDVPEEAFPGGLKDFFLPAGVFEGIPIRHSRRFI